MSSDLGPYSRHYWSLVDDEKFADVYDNDHHYATWSRLLMIADQAWPASAHLPVTARKASIAKLAEVQLIDLLPGGRFRIHGLDDEREKRSIHGKNAAASRWGNLSNASGNARSNARSNAVASEPRMPSKAEQSKEEQSTPRATDPADVYWTLTGRYPSEKVVGWIDDLGSRYGTEAVIRALAKCHIDDRQTSTLMGRVDDNLKAEARALDLKEQAAERERLKEKRSQPRPIRDEAAIQAEIRRLMEPGAAA